jgi:hypothetical protein
MKYLVCLTGAAIIFLSSQSSFGQDITGAQLLDFCNAPMSDGSNPTDDWKPMSCVMYISGFVSAFAEMEGWKVHLHRSISNDLFCPNGDVSIHEYTTVFKSFIMRQKEFSERPAQQSLMAALVQGFPCKQGPIQ